ncbi:hypothetical protein FRAHR75_40048 [Frankia sp. Hr75.2]|nr:hypothetical protein FRAHR75_40048 [Frankia sp. Hr75.2]SQD93686.1 hypothetical protein FMEAI12_1810048 [Parafrankia sp. Ea1.12]
MGIQGSGGGFGGAAGAKARGRCVPPAGRGAPTPFEEFHRCPSPAQTSTPRCSAGRSRTPTPTPPST